MGTPELNNESFVIVGDPPTRAITPRGRQQLPDIQQRPFGGIARKAAQEVEPRPAPKRSGQRRGTLSRCLADSVLIVGFYTAYAAIRNTQGGRLSPALESKALAHGLLILDLEKKLGLDHEAALQSLFLRFPSVMKASNIFYATAHFIVTAVVLAWLTASGGRQHARWRNTLGLSTAVALVCFAVFPTMPPRLLPDHPALIDTLREIGGFWSFQTPAIEKIADPFAAVPSLHVAWATWVACALWWRLSRTWMKVLAISYPVLTSVIVVATANHYILDILAALVVLSISWLLVRSLEQGPARLLRRWRGRRRSNGRRTLASSSQ